jgi:hypothetical protein
MIKTDNPNLRCAAGRFCISICSRHSSRDDCPAFYIKKTTKDFFTEDFVPYQETPKRLRTKPKIKSRGNSLWD